MPKPSPEHAPIMAEIADEIRKAYPKATIFTWHMLDNGGSPVPYVGGIFTKDGDRIEGGMPNSPENRILAKHHKALGWDQREDGLQFAFSVIDALEIMDSGGTGLIDEPYRDHPGLEMYSY